MKLRLYNALTDYEFLQKWINDERAHALWCANRIPYPMTSENLQEVLAVNTSNNSGFLRFVIVDKELRGKGYGIQLIEMALKYAFEVVGVSFVQLNVFDVNDKAKKCYSNAGFVVDSIAENAFTFNDESWGRCHMVVFR